MKSASLLIAVACAAGCAFDVSEPTPARPPTLLVTVVTLDINAPQLVDIEARFDPGIDAHGRPIEVLGDTLRMLGISMIGERRGDGLVFHADRALADVAHARAEPIVMPRTAAGVQSVHNFAFSLLHSTATDSLIITDSLTLPLSDSSPGHGAWRWSIAFMPELPAEGSFSLNVNNRPAVALVVPASLFDAAGRGMIHANLTRVHTLEDTGYVLQVSERSIIRRPVRIMR